MISHEVHPFPQILHQDLKMNHMQVNQKSSSSHHVCHFEVCMRDQQVLHQIVYHQVHLELKDNEHFLHHHKELHLQIIHYNSLLVFLLKELLHFGSHFLVDHCQIPFLCKCHPKIIFDNQGLEDHTFPKHSSSSTTVHLHEL